MTPILYWMLVKMNLCLNVYLYFVRYVDLHGSWNNTGALRQDDYPDYYSSYETHLICMHLLASDVATY